MWQMRWHNMSIVTINVMLQILDIYIYIYRYMWGLIEPCVQTALEEARPNI